MGWREVLLGRPIDLEVRVSEGRKGWAGKGKVQVQGSRVWRPHDAKVVWGFGVLRIRTLGGRSCLRGSPRFHMVGHLVVLPTNSRKAEEKKT